MHALSGARKALRCYHRAKDAAGDAAPHRNRGMMGARKIVNFLFPGLLDLIEPNASNACAKQAAEAHFLVIRRLLQRARSPAALGPD